MKNVAIIDGFSFFINLRKVVKFCVVVMKILLKKSVKIKKTNFKMFGYQKIFKSNSSSINLSLKQSKS